MSDMMTQEDAMNMSNEQAVQILLPMRNMMIDRNGCPISDAVFALDKAIEALSAEPQWIPVTERLPEEDYCSGRGVQYSESVLITVINHSNDDDTFVDMAYTADGKWQLGYPHENPFIPQWCEVIAWMPLPKVYRGEDDE